MSSTAHAVSAPHLTDTGIPNSKLGMWLFIASEIMFFTGLLAAYVILRIGHPHWPGSEGHLSVAIGTTNTLILLCSSTTIVMALADAQRGRHGASRAWLLATVLLGSLFVGIKGYEYSLKFEHHIYPSTNIFWSCYFVLTGFHGLHVIGGIIANLYLLFKSSTGRLPAAKVYQLELAGLYWHFVDIVWLFLFPMIYLI